MDRSFRRGANRSSAEAPRTAATAPSVGTLTPVPFSRLMTVRTPTPALEANCRWVRRRPRRSDRTRRPVSAGWTKRWRICISLPTGGGVSRRRCTTLQKGGYRRLRKRLGWPAPPQTSARTRERGIGRRRPGGPSLPYRCDLVAVVVVATQIRPQDADDAADGGREDLGRVLPQGGDGVLALEHVRHQGDADGDDGEGQGDRQQGGDGVGARFRLRPGPVARSTGRRRRRRSRRPRP